MTDRPHDMFVYGTLRGHERGRKATLYGATRDSGNLPNITPDKEGQVEGEVFSVTEQTLNDLDRYESEGSLYHRIEVDGHWVYIGHPEKTGGGSHTFDKQTLRQKLADGEIEINE